MIKNYKLFFTPACPSCHEVKKFMVTVSLNGDFVDATTAEGEELVKRYDIMSVPTIVFLDDKNKEVSRASTIEEVKRVINNKSLF